MDFFGERLSKYLAHHNMSANEFGTSRLGYDKAEKISRLLRNEKNKPSYEILVDIANNCTDLNIEWLITGEGEMLKEEQPYKKTIVKTYATRDRGLYDELDALWQEVERLNEELKTCQQTASNLP